VKTNKKGSFQILFDLGFTYRLEIYKTGYASNLLLVDLKKIEECYVEKGLILENIELLMNSYISDNEIVAFQPFGRLFFDSKSQSFSFEELNIRYKKGLFSKEKIENPSVSLILKALLKNSTEKENVNSPKSKSVAVDSKVQKNNQQRSLSTFGLKNKKIEEFSIETIKFREADIKEARKALESDKLNAKTAQDSLNIEKREAFLELAENELELAKKLIDSQDTVIVAQRWVLVLLTGVFLLVLALLFIIFRNYKERKALNLILEQKNKNITASINYAKRIQNSILITENDIKKILPNSFVFYQPRDIVSGDFYLFSEINQKIVVAAVDCTGHGVPGAFMSFIGYTLLNEIINEKKITRPSEILIRLHKGIVSLLRQDTNDLSSQDGMELSICVIDKKTRILEYAGAMNPVHIVSNNEIITLSPDDFAIGGIEILPKNTTVVFTDKQFQLNNNDMIYLFSDGYTDQFGGEENLKFNLSRFKKLLVDISNKNLDEQHAILSDTINNWKGNYKQIDDMLIIGIRL
jgi:serine phosphatase RsbU (regulator of sigma subunit)